MYIIYYTPTHIFGEGYTILFIYLFLHSISYIDIYIFPLYKHKYKCKINHTIIQAQRKHTWTNAFIRHSELSLDSVCLHERVKPTSESQTLLPQLGALHERLCHRREPQTTSYLPKNLLEFSISVQCQLCLPTDASQEQHLF